MFDCLAIITSVTGNSGERRGAACNTLCDGSGQMTRKARVKSFLRPNPKESSDGEDISRDGCAPVQEHSEPAKPAREHVTTVDGEI